MRLMAIALVASFAGLQAFAEDPWPSPDWTSAMPEEVGIHPESLKEAIRYSFEGTNETHGLVLIKDGKLVFEKYSHGFKPDQLHITWSVTKSIFGLLTGIAEKQGYLKRSDPAHKYYPALKEDKKSKITIDHLLSMASGIRFKEVYEANPFDSHVVSMLFGKGYRDMAAYTAGIEMTAKPGEAFLYSSGETNLLSAVLRGALGEERYHSYPWKELFEPIGIKNATIEKDKAGNFIASSYLYLSPRDMAKIGWLFLKKGNWNGKQLISEEFIDYSSRNSLARIQAGNSLSDGAKGYGGNWWLNRPLPGEKPQNPNSPEDMVMALGHHGQRIIILPTQNIVIARTGLDKVRSIRWEIDDFVSKLLSKSKESL